MRYRVGKHMIRTENSAKSPKEAAKPLVKWLTQHVHVRAALDYGCGRLRYSGVLARHCSRLGLVDSPNQLDRSTTVSGAATTIRQLALRTWPSCSVYTIADFWAGVSERYDFVLCANVLPIIPSKAIRQRTLQAIRVCLAPAGRLLVVNQHTNSYFTQARKHPKAQDHLDGWVLASPKGASYFGLLPLKKTIHLLESNDFVIHDAWIEGQSNYVLAGE
jgi:hypothetical protein